MVVKKVNAGDPVAEHELGLRYLMGEDFDADTEKAAYWIGKAADQNMISAQYNYGLLLNNGWGVAWNPFEAYRRFLYAAAHGLVEAEYVYGLLLTDDLIVPRNYTEAYRWIAIAADSGFAPAQEVLQEFAQRGIMARIRSRLNDSSTMDGIARSGAALHSTSGARPVLLDFSVDSIREPDIGMLMREVHLAKGGQLLKGSVDTQHVINDTMIDADTVRSLLAAAGAGSPEVLTMLGRLYQQGDVVKKDVLLSALYYAQAIRFDSPWAPMLLWNMIHRETFFPLLKERIDAGDPAAEFLWAELIEFGFDNQLTEAQTIALLKDAAQRGYVEAIVQLAMCYYTGRWVKQDRLKADELFRHAEELGNEEAKIRLYTIKLRDGQTTMDVERIVDSLQRFVDRGSILAESVLGYCYQKGAGVRHNTSQAVYWYRRAAQRGSKVAYAALQKLYDELRPTDPIFMLE